MSNKLQDPRVVRTVLILAAAVIVGGTGWYVMRSKDNANKSLDNVETVQATEENNKNDAYKGWKSYTWTSQAVSFKHPDAWVTQENAGMSRLYVKNSQVNLLKEETPADFQQLWVSYDSDEASKAREDAIKKGESAYREVMGEVKASTIKSGSLTINTYEYTTVGGVTLEAYWTDKAGKRYFATNSTEVGEQNQKDMVANLKKLLATVSFVE